MADPRKINAYMPTDMLAELKAESARQDRSVSRLLQRAWMLARAKIREMPGAEEKS